MNGTFKYLFIWGLSTCCFIAAPAATVDDLVPGVYTNAQGRLPYRLFIPTNYNPSLKYPIVLFMHGSGESGTDNRLQLTVHTGVLVFASATNQSRYPSFLVAQVWRFGRD
jgi:predicted peptidase